MREYELYVPLCYNDGRVVESEKLTHLKKRLVDQFGGLTHFPQESEGLWKIGAHTFRDKIVILRVIADHDQQDYFSELKAEVEREWAQEDFLIITREVSTL
ncbi:MAG: hypothetical protein ACR2OZ_18380 [Verrucomicrobiales bacterium]